MQALNTQSCHLRPRARAVWSMHCVCHSGSATLSQISTQRLFFFALCAMMCKGSRLCRCTSQHRCWYNWCFSVRAGNSHSWKAGIGRFSGKLVALSGHSSLRGFSILWFFLSPPKDWGDGVSHTDKACDLPEGWCASQRDNRFIGKDVNICQFYRPPLEICCACHVLPVIVFSPGILCGFHVLSGCGVQQPNLHETWVRFGQRECRPQKLPERGQGPDRTCFFGIFGMCSLRFLWKQEKPKD